jgi:hypothetical protein
MVVLRVHLKVVEKAVVLAGKMVYAVVAMMVIKWAAGMVG